MLVQEQARLLGYVSSSLDWPPGGPQSSVWSMLGNTWPVNVIASLLSIVMRVIDDESWNGGDVSWTQSSHALMLLDDALA